MEEKNYKGNEVSTSEKIIEKLLDLIEQLHFFDAPLQTVVDRFLWSCETAFRAVVFPA